MAKKGQSLKKINAHNDSVFDSLIKGIEKSVKQTIIDCGVKTIELTPSSKLNAPNSRDVASNLWRWDTKPQQIIQFTDETHRLSFADSNQTDSHKSLLSIKNKMWSTNYIFASNLTDYANDLEIGYSQSSSGMVMKTDAFFHMQAKNNFMKEMNKI
ncbi:hypothetical protein NTE28_003588 [Vibrio harveyi]|nr:hypothetical protein [Vibrio harveyi]